MTQALMSVSAKEILYNYQQMIGKTVKNLLGYEHIIDWSSHG